MSWELVPLQAGHVTRFFEEATPAEQAIAGGVEQFGVPSFLASHNSWALLSPVGSVQALGGTIEQWKRRHVAWLYVSLSPEMSARQLLRAIDIGLAPVRGRIEATVRADYDKGHRLARAAGFSVENPPGLLRSYGPEGEDHVLYVRFQ